MVSVSVPAIIELKKTFAHYHSAVSYIPFEQNQFSNNSPYQRHSFHHSIYQSIKEQKGKRKTIMGKQNNLTRQGVRNLDALPSKSKGRVLDPVPIQCEHRRTKISGCHIVCIDCKDELFDSNLHGRGERVRI